MSAEQIKDGVRMFETKQGLESIPASQKPISPQEYFANERVPEVFKLYDIYVTESGPVLEKKPLMEWTSEHDKKLDEIVSAAQSSIDQKGYYLRNTTRHIKSLTRGTEKPVQDAFDAFHQKFHDKYGQSPSQLVDEWRIGRGLPVSTRSQDQGIEQELDM